MSELPDGWSRQPLSSLGEVLKAQGGTKADDVPTGVPVVRYGELYTRHHDVIREFASFVSEEAAPNYTALVQGDVLFAGSGETIAEIGKSAVYLSEERALGSGDLVIFRPSDRVDPLFAGYASNAPDAVRQKMRMGQGSSVMHIYGHQLAKLELPLPPLAEQKKIAAILSSVDEAIRANEAVIEQTRRVKEGLLQELLTDAMTRYPPATMRDLCMLITKGTTPPKDAYVMQGGVPFLRVGNLSFDGDLHTSELLYVSESVHSSLLKRSILYPNDVLTNIVGPPLGQVSVVPDIHPQWNMNQAVAVFRADRSRTSALFLSALLQWERTKEWLKSRGKQTSGQVNLTLELCGNAPACLPPIEVQSSIGRMIQAVDDVRRASVAGVSSLQSTKSGLLQDLLTGKVRVTP